MGRSGLAQAVQEELGTKVAFENDVNLAALGEQWLGLGKDVENFVYLHVGTGVGAGLILRGELYRGHTGAAGEVGYLPIGGDPRDKVLRRRGVLDTEAGASGVVATARRLGMVPPLSARKVFAAARRGDRIARRVVELEADRIALAAAAIVPIVDPELVVLGGGIGRNGDLLLEPGRRRSGDHSVRGAARDLAARRGGGRARRGVDGAPGGPGPALHAHARRWSPR